MNRRHLLTRCAGASAALVAVSGCTEETLAETETKPPFIEIDDEELDLPVDQQVEVVEAAVVRADDAEIETIDDLEAFLDDEGLPVERLEEVEKPIAEKLETEREDIDEIDNEPHGTGTVLALAFVHPDRTETGTLELVGLVAGGYAALVASGNDAELLEATVLDDAAELFGSFHVLAEWAEEYNEGTTSARSYGTKPWMTMKTVPSGDL
ncbi:hypothetical protein [Halopiger xanaduensis]|uniref:DUF8159 domain-containing protein n=1 Tax=Halopiger xanaduensis (strain DSM 18323 / JCM 14033 / SH-6) TaxID=797210 RepID=F8D5I4_HALXS|nr:hypothetical protein [Halopiger xanaduensis]AEH38820.1 hypothetical protein Halxa_4218 [Halopiger xanaduensis SH-6]